jgi:colanic acid/amylovoran biosynthesis glycosyltransferase
LTEGGVLLVYRDRIVPRSEAHFLRRQYVGFRRLRPIWIGCRTDVGLPDLGVEPMLLGRRGAGGALDRLLFKQFGHIPPEPDLAMLQPRLIHAHCGMAPRSRARAIRVGVSRE